ncbi:hypothetical protein B4O97_07520 [Marispirochaeta aestuarii]|uniref:DUF4352 domain-containing protein n=1 Tax=Marispirochaeta aestuarii TaxID=1963862 RepID=A0A1Y1RZ56_9SPIO|nr:hypothetical protein [Marispirochaeta aestuarii]ORC35911.1 hypothetical protein B4O97_07520 [Marispirochaeta aestuarii]
MSLFRIRTFTFPLFILILFVFLISGCTTADPVRYERVVHSIQSDNYNIQIRIVEAEELERQSGRIPSPFVIEPGVFDPREYVVFEVVIKNKSDHGAMFELKDLELKMGAANYYTKNGFQIKQYWEKQDDVKSADRNRMDKIIDRHVFPRKIEIPSDGLKRGYVVFLARMPKYGEMTLFLPIFGDGFKPDIYEFTFPFTKI